MKWILSRNTILLYVLAESCIIFILTKINFITINNFSNNFLLNFFIYIFIWTFFGYLLKRYDMLLFFERKSWINRIILKTLLVETVFIFIYYEILGSPFYTNQTFPNLFVNYIQLLTSIFTLISFQIISKFLLLKFNKNIKNKWIFINNISLDEEKKFFLTETLKIEAEILFLFPEEICKIESFDEFEGLITLNESNLKQDFLDFLLKLNIKNNIKIISLFNWCEIFLQKIPVELISSEDILINNLLQKRTNYLRIKRVGDFIFAILLIILTFPIVLLSIILVYLEDGLPLFYSQKRNGWNNSIIDIYKIRTLSKNLMKN